MTPHDSDRDRRLLFLAPTSRDGATTEAMLSPLGIRLDVCRTFEELLRELTAGAGAILLPEEAASRAHTAALRAVLAQQPPWSDLPVLILTRPGADSAESAEAVRTLGNVTLLERPVRLATLLTAVRTALRARDRQYQIREHLAERVAIRGVAAPRRPAQGRVPRHAGPRAAQSAGAAADRRAAAEGRPAARIRSAVVHAR